MLLATNWIRLGVTVVAVAMVLYVVVAVGRIMFKTRGQFSTWPKKRK